MARCNYCKKWILGGIKEGTYRYCSKKCREDGFLVPVVESVDTAALDSFVHDVHQQSCSNCGCQGPVDLYTKYSVTSLIFHFSWTDSPKVCCRRCGVRSILSGMTWTFLFGWWNVPFGIVATPWQLGRGVRQLSPVDNCRELLTITCDNAIHWKSNIWISVNFTLEGESDPLIPNHSDLTFLQWAPRNGREARMSLWFRRRDGRSRTHYCSLPFEPLVIIAFLGILVALLLATIQTLQS